MKKLIFAVAAFATLSQPCQAAWTTLSLPTTTSWGNTTIGHLPDGRFLYGHNGSLVQQSTFGSSPVSAYTNAPAGDYGFVTSQFVGLGGFGPAPVYSYSASALATAFSSISSAYQVYHAVNYDTTSMLLVGTAGGNSDLAYLNTSGTYVTLIDGISTYSGGIASDSFGNVYVADDDDRNIYKFTSAQIAGAIGGTALTMANGTLIANLGVSGSLAVDTATNRIYASGWQLNGIQVFDITLSQSGTIVPGLANSNYQVTTFSDGSNQYVGWIDRGGWTGTDSLTYGYDISSLVPVPEPSALGMLMMPAGAWLLLRRLRITS